MSTIFNEGFSFSGFERNGLYLSMGTKGEGESASNSPRQGGSEGSVRFVDISGVSGIDAIEDGRGIAFADFDNDGDTDIFLTNIQGETHRLFKNEVGATNRFLRVSLEGVQSGKDAYGAVVRVKTPSGILTKMKSGGSGFLSQHDPRLLFGLGSAEAVAWLSVTWPSGLKQRFEGILANTAIEIVEGDSSYRVVDENRFQLPVPLSRDVAFLDDLKVRKGDVFPNLKLFSLRQETTTLDRVRVPGRGYLVNLWATYCIPCINEMPELQKLHSRYKDKNIEVLGISLDLNAPGKVKRFLDEYNIDYPIYLADAALAEQLYATTEKVFIPISFILDGDGRIVEIFTGWSEEKKASISAQLSRLAGD